MSTDFLRQFLDTWDDKTYERDAMIEHEQEMLDVSTLPSMSVIAPLMFNSSLFFFVCGTLWQKPHLMVFYAPCNLFSLFSLCLMWPITAMSWWTFRNNILVVLYFFNVANFAYCSVPFVQDCFDYWAFFAISQNYTVVDVAIQTLAMFFAVSSLGTSCLAMLTCCKTRACDRLF